MPEEDKLPIPEGVEISESVIKPDGKVAFMNKDAFSNPAPEKLKRIIKALTYFCAGLVTVVGATDLFSGRQAKIISFVIGVFVLALGAAEIAFGVKSEPEKRF